MKITKRIKDRRERHIDHLNRIQGQIATLKKYMAEDKGCIDIALLTTSIAKSFDSLRTRTLEGFILNEVLDDRALSTDKTAKLNRVLNLYKK